MSWSDWVEKNRPLPGRPDRGKRGCEQAGTAALVGTEGKHDRRRSGREKRLERWGWRATRLSQRREGGEHHVLGPIGLWGREPIRKQPQGHFRRKRIRREQAPPGQTNSQPSQVGKRGSQDRIHDTIAAVLGQAFFPGGRVFGKNDSGIARSRSQQAVDHGVAQGFEPGGGLPFGDVVQGAARQHRRAAQALKKNRIGIDGQQSKRTDVMGNPGAQGQQRGDDIRARIFLDDVRDKPIHRSHHGPDDPVQIALQAVHRVPGPGIAAKPRPYPGPAQGHIRYAQTLHHGLELWIGGERHGKALPRQKLGQAQAGQHVAVGTERDQQKRLLVCHRHPLVAASAHGTSRRTAAIACVGQSHTFCLPAPRSAITTTRNHPRVQALSPLDHRGRTQRYGCATVSPAQKGAFRPLFQSIWHQRA
jgi:hypothetical protein